LAGIGGVKRIEKVKRGEKENESTCIVEWTWGLFSQDEWGI
jgi:hypothetical protein